MQKTLKTSKKKKNVSRPRMDEKKLHTWEFQLKGILRNMKYKLLPKKFYWKNSRVFQMLAMYFHWKDIFTELNRYIFQISLKYIKLVIPKILCTLVLCSFDFYFKIAWPPPPPPSNKHTPPPNNITPHTKIKISSCTSHIKPYNLISSNLFATHKPCNAISSLGFLQRF